MRHTWAAGACGAVILAATVSVPAQTGTGATTVASHVAAAQAAADDSWLILYSELCGGAMGFGGRASSLPPARGGAGGARQSGRLHAMSGIAIPSKSSTTSTCFQRLM